MMCDLPTAAYEEGEFQEQERVYQDSFRAAARDSAGRKGEVSQALDLGRQAHKLLNLNRLRVLFHTYSAGPETKGTDPFVS